MSVNNNQYRVTFELRVLNSKFNWTWKRYYQADTEHEAELLAVSELWDWFADHKVKDKLVTSISSLVEPI